MSHFLFYTLLSVLIQGLFALFEMAAVSFNKVRLQYYVSQGKRRALWLNHLLQRPSRLFGTTLIGINTALQVGSECARQFYESIHLDPDWAPLTQVLIVVIFGELAPMFGARRHSERLALFFVPLMVLLSKILSPIIWAFDTLSRLVHRAIGTAKDAPLFLSREEVKMAFEERKQDEIQPILEQMFQLKNWAARQLMTPLSEVHMLPSETTYSSMRHELSVHYAPFIPIYHRQPHNIVGIARLSDYLQFEEHKRVLEKARSPWFVTEETSILELLKQFRRNNQSIAVILDAKGQASGVLTLDQILAEIFGQEAKEISIVERSLYVDRTLSGEMVVTEFNRQFQANLPAEAGDTLSDLILRQLDHPPVVGEIVHIADFRFTVDELSLRGIRTLSVESDLV
jgi:CBS domain containing-hemolysin-like protein